MDYLNLTYRIGDHHPDHNDELNLLTNELIKRLVRYNYSSKTTAISCNMIIQIWKDQTKSRIDLPLLNDCLYITSDLLKQAILNLDLGIPLSVLHQEVN